MAVKGAKSIAEYAFRRWMADQNFAAEHFSLTVMGKEALLRDKNDDTLSLVYDSSLRTVYIKED